MVAAAVLAAGPCLTCPALQHLYGFRAPLHDGNDIAFVTSRSAPAGVAKSGAGSGAAAGVGAAVAPVKRSYKNGVAHVVNTPPCLPVSI